MRIGILIAVMLASTLYSTTLLIASTLLTGGKRA